MFESPRGLHGRSTRQGWALFAKEMVPQGMVIVSPAFRQSAGMGHWLIVSLPSCSKGVRFSLPAPRCVRLLARIAVLQTAGRGSKPLRSPNSMRTVRRPVGVLSLDALGSTPRSAAKNEDYFSDLLQRSPSGEDSPLIRATGAIDTRVSDHAGHARWQRARRL